jgi:hypothetical protein
MKLALLERLGTDPAPLVNRQRARIQANCDALGTAPDPRGFDRVLLAWRNANAAASLAFPDEIAASDRHDATG